MSQSASVSIIIPTFETNETKQSSVILLDSMLASFKSVTELEVHLPKIEIKIINDRSPVELFVKIGKYESDFAELGIKLSVYGLAKKGYSSGARNYGAEISQTKYLLFLDSDLTVSPSFWKSLFLILAKPGKDKAWQFYYDWPSDDQDLVSAFKQAWIHLNYDHHARQKISWIFSACYLIKRNYFQELGGYLPGSSSHDASDEVYLTDRLDRLEYCATVVPIKELHHQKVYSVWSLLKADFMRGLCQVRFMLRRMLGTILKEPKLILKRKVAYHISKSVMLSMLLGIVMLGALGVVLTQTYFGISLKWFGLFVLFWFVTLLLLNAELWNNTKINGRLRAISIPLLVISYINFGAAILWGIVSFPFTQKPVWSEKA